MGPLGDRQQAVHAQLVHVVALQDLEAEAVGLGQARGLLGKIGGRADIAWQVGKIAHQRGTAGDRLALDQSQFGGRQFVAPLDAESQLAQWPADIFLLRLQSIEAISCIERHHRRLADAPGNVALLQRQFS